MTADKRRVMRLRILTPGATTNKVIASIAVLGAAAAIAGLGTFATFTSSTSTSHTIASGTLSLTSGPTNRLGTGASLVAAGDSMQRAIDLNYAGSVDMGSATLTTSASPSSALDTDTTDGLHARDRQVLGRLDGVRPALHLHVRRLDLDRARLVGRSSAATSPSRTSRSPPGTTDHLRVTVTLPSTAGNAFQNLSSTVGYTFTGVQRAGTNQ